MIVWALLTAAIPPSAGAQGVASITTPGRGRLVTPSGVFPVGALTYTSTSQGRGLLELRAGTGVIRLSGADAQALGGSRHRLAVDTLVVSSVRSIEGACIIRFSPDMGGVRELACRGEVAPSRRPLALTWTASPGHRGRRSGTIGG